MLEQPLLYLEPWCWRTPLELPALEAPGWARRISAPQDEDALGFVRLLGNPWRWSWGARRLEVCETEDASLLLSLERGWFAFGRWRVVDAESCCVGEIAGAHVLDERRFRVATLWQERPDRHVLRRCDGTVIATLGRDSASGMLLRFADDLVANPYLRMVMLGACLVQERLPKWRG